MAFSIQTTHLDLNLSITSSLFSLELVPDSFITTASIPDWASLLFSQAPGGHLHLLYTNKKHCKYFVVENIDLDAFTLLLLSTFYVSHYILLTKFVLPLTSHVHQVHSLAEHLHLQLGSNQGNEEPQVSVLVPVNNILRSIRLKSFKHLFQLSGPPYLCFGFLYSQQSCPQIEIPREFKNLGAFYLLFLGAATPAYT